MEYLVHHLQDGYGQWTSGHYTSEDTHADHRCTCVACGSSFPLMGRCAWQRWAFTVDGNIFHAKGGRMWIHLIFTTGGSAFATRGRCAW